jgi:hypothetical protein
MQILFLAFFLKNEFFNVFFFFKATEWAKTAVTTGNFHLLYYGINMENITKQEYTNYGEPQQSPSHGQLDPRSAKQGHPANWNARL